MSTSKLGSRLLVASGVVIAATVIAAILVMGTPGTQRERAMDARRIADLSRIEQVVEAYHHEHGTLPTSLAALAARPGMGLATTDPESGLAYTYRAESSTAYMLCANFSTDSSQQGDGGRWGGVRWNDPNWVHGRGKTCFRRQVDKLTR